MYLRGPDRGLSRGPFRGRRIALDFKSAAGEILREAGRPLHYADITEIALEQGYLDSAGATPQNTMRARLSTDVRDNPESPFVRTAPGIFGLRGWSM